MHKPRILYASQAIRPYLPDNNIAIQSRLIAQGTAELGCEVRTFMPRFGDVNERRGQLHEVIRLSGLNIVIDDVDHPLIIKVASIQAARLQVYFIDNDDLFQRHGTVVDREGHPFEDNLERSIFFARGVLDTAQKLRWQPDVIHLHGWFTMLLPLYIDLLAPTDEAFAHTKLLVSLYDDRCADQWSDVQRKLWVKGANEKLLAKVKFDEWGSLMRYAIDRADALSVCTPSPDPLLLEYARSSGKPLLEYPEDGDLATAHSKFYQQIAQ